MKFTVRSSPLQKRFVKGGSVMVTLYLGP